MVIAGLTGQASAEPFKLAFPVECRPGQTCFIQQYVDMGEGDTVKDPFCRYASYQGHNGTDIRLLRLPDLNRKISVIAAQDGVVAGVRNSMKDRLVTDEASRKAIAGRECGNGVLLEHKEGWTTQYCHMARGSIKVRQGQTVSKGQELGFIGLSGLTEFPHLEFVVRKGGGIVDPFSGKAKESGCRNAPVRADQSLWSPELFSQLPQQGTQILDIGLAGQAVERSALLQGHYPLLPFAGDQAIVVWGWMINVQKDDQLFMHLEGPDGVHLSQIMTTFPSNKATFVAYGGKKRNILAGVWQGRVELRRNGQPIASKSIEARIQARP
jgi:hypothetical protein